MTHLLAFSTRRARRAVGALLALASGASLAVAVPPTPPQELTIAVGGDVMFGRVTSSGWRPHGGTDPFGTWGQTLANADVAFVNLETGICSQGRTHSRLPLLWAPPDRLRALTKVGVDVVSVANNHALDCGPDGVTQTRAALDALGIAAAGIAPTGSVRVSRNVVVFAATLHPPPYRARGARPVVALGSDLPPRIAHLRRQYPARLLVASLHWGRERASEPAAWQRDLARQLIAAGAQLIAGHGPHTPQPREQIGDGIVLYSVGNFVFDDQSPVGRPRAPAILRFRRTQDGWVYVPELAPRVGR